MGVSRGDLLVESGVLGDVLANSTKPSLDDDELRAGWLLESEK